MITEDFNVLIIHYGLRFLLTIRWNLNWTSNPSQRTNNQTKSLDRAEFENKSVSVVGTLTHISYAQKMQSKKWSAYSMLLWTAQHQSPWFDLKNRRYEARKRIKLLEITNEFDKLNKEFIKYRNARVAIYHKEQNKRHIRERCTFFCIQFFTTFNHDNCAIRFIYLFIYQCNVLLDIQLM